MPPSGGVFISERVPPKNCCRNGERHHQQHEQDAEGLGGWGSKLPGGRLLVRIRAARGRVADLGVCHILVLLRLAALAILPRLRCGRRIWAHSAERSWHCMDATAERIKDL